MTTEQSDSDLEQQLQQQLQQHYGEPPATAQVWARVASQLEYGAQPRPGWRQASTVPFPRRRPFPRLQHIIEAGLAVALVASLILAWLVVTRLPHNQSDATGKPLFTYTAHPGEGLYNAPDWTPDGRYMTFGLLQNSGDNVQKYGFLVWDSVQKYRFLVWDSVTGQVKQTLSFSLHNDQTHNTDISPTSPDGRYMSIYTLNNQEGSIQIGNILTGEVDPVYQWHNANTASSSLQVFMIGPFSPDSTRYAYVSPDNRIHIWDIQAKKVTVSSAIISIPRGLGFLSWSPDGKRLALTVSADSTWLGPSILQVWDSETGREIRSIAETPSMWMTAQGGEAWKSLLSPNGQQIITFNKDARTVQIRDSSSLRALHTFTAQVVASGDIATAPISSLYQPNWLANGKRVFFRDNRSAQVWDADTGQIVITFAIKNSNDLALPSDGGQFLITQIKGQPIEIWSTITGRKISQLGSDAGHAIADMWMHNDTYVALGSTKCQCLSLYDPLTGNLHASYRGDRLSLSWDNRYIAIGQNTNDAKHRSTIEVMRF